MSDILLKVKIKVVIVQLDTLRKNSVLVLILSMFADAQVTKDNPTTIHSLSQCGNALLAQATKL
jgi:hypothetical protein